MWVCNEHEKLFMEVKRSPKRLYKLLILTVKPSCILSHSDEVAHFWHLGLGHVNYKVMALISNEHMVRGFLTIAQFIYVCDG